MKTRADTHSDPKQGFPLVLSVVTLARGLGTLEALLSRWRCWEQSVWKLLYWLLRCELFSLSRCERQRSKESSCHCQRSIWPMLKFKSGLCGICKVISCLFGQLQRGYWTSCCRSCWREAGGGGRVRQSLLFDSSRESSESKLRSQSMYCASPRQLLSLQCWLRLRLNCLFLEKLSPKFIVLSFYSRMELSSAKLEGYDCCCWVICLCSSSISASICSISKSELSYSISAHFFCSDFTSATILLILILYWLFCAAIDILNLCRSSFSSSSPLFAQMSALITLSASRRSFCSLLYRRTRNYLTRLSRMAEYLANSISAISDQRLSSSCSREGWAMILSSKCSSKNRSWACAMRSRSFSWWTCWRWTSYSYSSCIFSPLSCQNSYQRVAMAQEYSCSACCWIFSTSCSSRRLYSSSMSGQIWLRSSASIYPKAAVTSGRKSLRRSSVSSCELFMRYYSNSNAVMIRPISWAPTAPFPPPRPPSPLP